jgi:hypothetical protein
MEKIIICLLLTAIAAIVYLKSKAKKASRNLQKTDDPLLGVPDIVGRPKVGGRPAVPNTAVETANAGNLKEVVNFETETQRDSIPVPQEGPEAAAGINWNEEEEEFDSYAANASYSTEEGLATGVTYDELATVGMLLERKAFEASERETAVGIAFKIDGTELLQLLESAVGDASQKIAILLDRGESQDAGPDPSSQRNDEDGFDIGDYV